MKAIVTILISIMLVACGSDEPLTPEQQEQQRLKDLTSQLSVVCKQRIRNSAKYPSKVDFHWSSQMDRLFLNSQFSKDPEYPHRFMYGIKADMMNAFGAMLPHTGSCLVEFNKDYSKYKVIELVVE